MAKILHVSDLHFCSNDMKTKIKEFEKEIKELLPFINFEFEYHDENVCSALQTLITRTNPEVIAITGDITTFGDKSSFDYAFEKVLQHQCSTDGFER